MVRANTSRRSQNEAVQGVNRRRWGHLRRQSKPRGNPEYGRPFLGNQTRGYSHNNPGVIQVEEEDACTSMQWLIPAETAEGGLHVVG